MPPKSEKQKKFFQLVLAYKKGEVDEDEVSQEVIDTAEDMSTEEIKKFANEPVQEVSQNRAVRQQFGELLQQYGDTRVSVTENSHVKEDVHGSTLVSDRQSRSMDITVSELVDLIQRRQYRKHKYTDMLISTEPARSSGTRHYSLEGDGSEAWEALLKRMEEINRVTETTTIKESDIRKIVREELKAESRNAQVKFYGVSGDTVGVVKTALVGEELDVIDEGRFISLNHKDVSGRVLELSVDGREIQARIGLTSLPGTMSSNVTVSGLGPQAFAKNVKRKMEKHSYE